MRTIPGDKQLEGARWREEGGGGGGDDGMAAGEGGLGSERWLVFVVAVRARSSREEVPWVVACVVRATPPLSGKHSTVGAGQASRSFAYAGKEGRRGSRQIVQRNATACLRW